MTIQLCRSQALPVCNEQQKGAESDYRINYLLRPKSRLGIFSTNLCLRGLVGDSRRMVNCQQHSDASFVTAMLGPAFSAAVVPIDTTAYPESESFSDRRA